MHWAGASYWGTRNRCLPNTSSPREVIGEEVRGGVPKIVARTSHPYPERFFLGWVHFTPLLTTVFSLLEYFHGFDSCNHPDWVFGFR